jgi:hypothetical protein
VKTNWLGTHSLGMILLAAWLIATNVLTVVRFDSVNTAPILAGLASLPACASSWGDDYSHLVGCAPHRSSGMPAACGEFFVVIGESKWLT